MSVSAQRAAEQNSMDLERRSSQPSRSNSHAESPGYEKVEPLYAPDDGSEETAPAARGLFDRAHVVPLSERRGLLGKLTLLPEFRDARLYPPLAKKLILVIVAFACILGPMGTNIIYPAIGSIMQDFGTSRFLVSVSVGTYLAALGIFPIWWSSLSDRNGRRTVYVLSFALLVVFSVGTAFSQNIETFIILRILCGAASASVQSVGAGTIADLYVPEERGRNLGYYYLGPLMAPLLSPIVSSLLVNRWSWRSTQWFMVILAAVTFLLLVFALPETLRTQDSKELVARILRDRRKQEPSVAEPAPADASPQASPQSAPADLASLDSAAADIASQLTDAVPLYDSQHNFVDLGAPSLTRIHSSNPHVEGRILQQDRERMRTGLERAISQQAPRPHQRVARELYFYLLRPLRSLYFLRYPPVLLAVLYNGACFAAVYVVNLTIEYCYSRPPYNMRPLYLGLLYIPNAATYIFSAIYGGRWVDALLRRYKRRHGVGVPEARLSWNVALGATILPLSLLAVGWPLHCKAPWPVPLIGTAFFGLAAMLIIGASTAYLVDSLPARGATAVALNNLIRMLLAAVCVFILDAMLHGMGPGWTMTLFAALLVCSGLPLYILKRKSSYWRENYDLQHLYDLVG
ncbi:AaceriACL172Cp [[Ashbya] aceris (nom. inval.)]|nr:AaceriACL172Cp [[Ashbya] aceris (nom. inval.)]